MLLLGSSGTGSHGEIAKAVDFDGTNDYLLRSSDLVGNADGKTFTFSAWVWVTDTATNKRIYVAGDDGSSTSSFFEMNNSEQLRIQLRNTSGTVNLNATLSLQPGWNNTWTHVLISIDLANSANRYVFVNDVDFTSSVTWTTYSNSNVDWTQTNHRVGRSDTGDYWKGRLSHVFLAYEYVDLSVEANRRIFISVDRKATDDAGAAWVAAGHTAPILYLPMTDPTTAHINLGTGGDMVPNGTIARSGRGPNQFNAPYSDLDGVADYLSRTTALTGIADGKAFTLSFCLQADALNNYQFEMKDGTKYIVYFFINTNGSAGLYARNSSDVNILVADIPAGTFISGRNYVIAASIDLSSTSNRGVYVNGTSASVTWTTYTNDTINFLATGTAYHYVGCDSGSGAFFNGRLGNLYFNTTYIDLSVASNLAKFVTGTGIDAKPADLGANGELPFGTAPLIYLPMYGNNAGKNYGSGGDFTVNSGPYTGARGPNEYFGNKADFVPNAYLYANTNLSLVKSFSASFYVTFDDTGTGRNVFSSCGTAILNPSIQIQRDGTTNKLLIACMSGGGATVLYAESNTTFSAGTYYIQLGIDLSDTGKRKIFSNGVEVAVTYTNYNNTAIASTSFVTVGCYCSNNGGSLGNYLDGKLSEFYFTTDYIDFSQEANRLLFRDAFGNPTDLPAAIAAGSVPNPAVYMRFDPANQGLNAGTGGNFTKSGTITDGGQL